jgi:hypothetical protein
MGGTVVQNDEQVQVYTKMFRRPIEPGDAIEEEPCIPKGLLRIYPEEHEGRPCPRVQLMVRNLEAYTLAGVLMREDTRVMFPAIFDRLVEGYPREDQLQVLQRVNAALQSSDVNDALGQRLKTASGGK